MDKYATLENAIELRMLSSHNFKKSTDIKPTLYAQAKEFTIEGKKKIKIKRLFF